VIKLHTGSIACISLILALGAPAPVSARNVTQDSQAGAAEEDRALPYTQGGKAGLAAELRQWLARRRLDRGKPGRFPVIEETSALARPSYVLQIPHLPSDGQRRRPRVPIVHFERGPDGRIHHRYDFNAEEVEE
jgi:hypothetical protein